MAETLDLERDEFLMLLTEALRAGPGSPEWRQAVGELRKLGEKGNEYQMLMAAREHLESGRDYRSVRAGPNFTRKVLGQIENENPKARRSARLSVASLVTTLAAMAGIVVIIVVGYFLFRGSSAGRGTADDLAAQVFTTTQFTTTISGDIDAQWRAIGAFDAQWRPIGALPLDASDGLRLKTEQAGDTDGLGGGVVYRPNFAPGDAFALDVSLRAGVPAEGVAMQVFVTDQPQFSEDKGTSPHELVCLIQQNQVSVVLPGGRVKGEVERIRPRTTIAVRMAVNRNGAIISVGDHRLYSGENQLDPSKPRYIGVRFLRLGDEKAVKPALAGTVLSLRVLTP
jgi:hypothetical protein